MAEPRISKEPVLDGRSPVRAAALAVVLEAPGHGWDVARRVNRRMGPSWKVLGKHIYPTLKQLEADGLLRCEREPSEQPPYWRDVYYPTERAEQARREWLCTPPARAIIRTDLQARIAFSTEDDIPMLLHSLEECRADVLEEIEDNAEGEPPRVSWLGTIMSLYRAGVDKRLRAEMEWIEEAIRELKAFETQRSRR